MISARRADLETGRVWETRRRRDFLLLEMLISNLKKCIEKLSSYSEYSTNSDLIHLHPTPPPPPPPAVLPWEPDILLTDRASSLPSDLLPSYLRKKPDVLPTDRLIGGSDGWEGRTLWSEGRTEGRTLWSEGRTEGRTPDRRVGRKEGRLDGREDARIGGSDGREGAREKEPIAKVGRREEARLDGREDALPRGGR